MDQISFAWTTYHMRRSKMTSNAVILTLTESKCAICTISKMWRWAESKLRRQNEPQAFKAAFLISLFKLLREMTMNSSMTVWRVALSEVMSEQRISSESITRHLCETTGSSAVKDS